MKDESIKLLRHGLGMIDLSDIEDQKDITEQERKDYCAAIHAVWPRLEKDIKKFLYKQLIFSSNQSENWEQVLVGRGAFAGIELLMQHWEAANQEYIAGLSYGDYDKFKSIGEI